MVQAANARGLEGWLSRLAKDARLMPPGAEILEDKSASRVFASKFLELPTFSLTHHPADSIVMVQSGDVAYVSYAHELIVPRLTRISPEALKEHTRELPSNRMHR
jgi:hypothetical protein